MTQLEDEIAANHGSFLRDWTDAHARNVASLQTSPVYLASYKRLVALQALKVHVVEPHYTSNSAAFFFEAHNDALVSHVTASSGAWRSALQSLRSCIENTLAAVYYGEHPVELELWAAGRFRLSYSELMKYAEKHPKLASVDSKITGLPVIDREYATLSKAVHASAANFRMTDAASRVLLWSDDQSRASQWATRERRTLESICLLMIAKHHELVQGSRLVPLREVLGLILPKGSKTRLKSLGVNIP
jgi:hypothetical protein